MYNLETKSLLPFTEEHEKWRAEFGKFLDEEIVPHYLEWEKACGVPHEVFKKFGDHGYGCLWLDKKYGGQEKDLLYTIIYGEELSKRGLNGVLTRLEQRHCSALHLPSRHRCAEGVLPAQGCLRRHLHRYLHDREGAWLRPRSH